MVALKMLEKKIIQVDSIANLHIHPMCSSD